MPTKSNMLTGTLWDKILWFAFPLAATGILQQLFNAADLMVVGRFSESGEIAMAAVGTNAPVVGLILNLFIGTALGATVVIAWAIGMNDRRMISRAAHTSIAFSLIAGTLVAIFCEILAEKFFIWMNVPAETLAASVLYFRVYVAGLPVVLLYNFEAAIFRAVGDTKTPLIVLALAGMLNVALNFLFVLVFKMTVDGVALATVIANFVSAIALFWRLEHSHSDLKISLKKLKIDRHALAQILKIGVPAGLQAAVFNIANVVIQGAINSLGTLVMAASSAAFNIEILAYLVMNSFSQACTTFVGQNYGAKLFDRCNRVLLWCLGEGSISAFLAVAGTLIFGHELLALFNASPEIAEIGFVRLVLVFISYAFAIIYDNLAGYLRGVGISLVPALLTMLGVCGTRFFWVYEIFPRERSFFNLMLVYPVSLAITAVLLIAAFIFYKTRSRSRRGNAN